MTVKYTVPAKPKRSCPIIMQQNALTVLPKLLHDLGDVDRVFILYDHAVQTIATAVQKSCGDCAMAAVPSGEASKSLAQVERLSADFFLRGLTDRSVLICVGGGVAMDLGTFVAGVYAGGMRSILIPTNFMAMADAAFGGRGYVDIGNMKNLVCVRHYPSAVIIDMTILSQLPSPLLRAGLVEVVKIAAIADAEFFGWLCEHMDALQQGEMKIIETCITNAIRIKTELMADESSDRRLFSTFGHTVGHALEALTQCKISHAEAVSIGMLVEMRMANAESTEQIAACLQRLNMPKLIPLEFHNQALWDIMQRDRKARNGQVRIAVPKKIGAGELRAVTFEDLARARM